MEKLKISEENNLQREKFDFSALYKKTKDLQNLFKQIDEAEVKSIISILYF